MNQAILDGIKVISAGSAWAGPYVSRVLAELGAEVFRIELHGGTRFGRGTSETEEAWRKKLLTRGMSQEDVEKAAKLTPGDRGNYLPGTYGIGLSLRNDKGKEVYKKLVKKTDIVIDGFSPRVMASFNLNYSALKEIKPDIIYASIPATGLTGPEKDMRMWGTGCEFVGGLTSTRGYLNGRPHRAACYIADGIASPHILTAILSALNYRADTGKGQHIEIAQAECATSIMGEAIMDYSLNGRIAKPTGNQHSSYAPHNAYRCKGEDMWVTIAVTSEEEWENLCGAMGNPGWTKDSRFTDMLSRWQNQEELDKLIESWTIQHDHYAVQQILQKAGVPAAAVVTLEEHVLYDPQVKDRGLYQWLTYHDGVDDPIFRVPWVLPETPTVLNRCAPYAGQHNEYLLKSILEIPDDEISELVNENVVGVTPPETL
jgi:benzylsuccinate CoA-transferase BbsF subunit